MSCEGLRAEPSPLTTSQKSADGLVGPAQATLVRHPRLKGGATDRPSRNAGGPKACTVEKRRRLTWSREMASGEVADNWHLG